MSGLRKPKNTRFGTDFAGTVEAVGKNVTNFKPGDEVFGAKNGAVAEYVCVKADRADRDETEQHHIRASGLGRRCRADGVARSSRQGTHSGRTKSFDQRRVGRRRYVRGANRESVRRRGHRLFAARAMSIL